MPEIKWCGNKPWDTDFPEIKLPANAKKLIMPDNIFIASIPYGIFPLIVCYAVIVIKWFVLAERTINPLFVPLGIVIGFLLLPVHELLHAVCYRKGQTVYIGISMDKCAAFAVCHEPISRSRFIVMSLMPILLGVFPMMLFLLLPPSGTASGILIPSMIMGMLSPMPDFMDICKVLRQVPRKAMIQSNNQGLFWFPKNYRKGIEDNL